MKKTIGIISFLLLLTFAFGQEVLKSLEEEYYDFLSLQGIVDRPTLGFRTLSDSVWNVSNEDIPNVSNVWFNKSLHTPFTLFSEDAATGNFFLDGIKRNISLRLYSPEWFNSYNPDFPYGFNDGALWQGVGYNTSFSTGIRLEGFGFELTFKPVFAYSQNKEYDYLQSSLGGEYGYFTDYQRIDIVQRYGDQPFINFNWGDSEIRYTWYTLTFGFGTQSPWLGTTWLNPMLGSNNADSYPKFDVGIRKTPLIIPFINWYAGDIEGRIWVGYLKNSDYFNASTEAKENDRMATMGSFSFKPAGTMGLTVGFNRLFLTYWDLDNLSYIQRLFTLSQENGNGTDCDEDQKVSVYADWLLPDSGFEVYGEFGIDDFSSNIFPNPFHTGIFTIGIKQAIHHSDTLHGLLNLEWNSFEMSQDFQLQWMYGGYYFHSSVQQGFTNNGQIIGAGTGSMGNSQYLGYTLYYPKGKTTISAHRWCPDNNYIFNKAVNNNGTNGLSKWYAMYETYLATGADTTFFLTRSLAVSGGAKMLIDVFPQYTDDICQYDISYNLSFGLKYTF